MRSAVDYDMGVPKAVPRMRCEIYRMCSVIDYVMGVPKAVPRQNALQNAYYHMQNVFSAPTGVQGSPMAIAVAIGIHSYRMRVRKY